MRTMKPRVIVPEDTRSFVDATISKMILEDALEWIGENLYPEDVFTQEQLEMWAKEEGYEHQIDPG